MKRFLASLLVLFCFQNVDAHNSEETRAEKHVIGVLQPVGLGPGLNESLMGLEAGIFLSANDILSIQKRQFFEAVGGGDYGSTFRGNSYGLHYKRFFGDSFYVTTGLDYYEFSEGSGRHYSSQPRTYTDGNVVAAELAIGNEWQWSAFTLGCDWLGVVAPLSKKITRTTGSYQSSSFLDSANVELLRFYLGFAF